MNSRIQLSLYVPPVARGELDAIRELLDPIQARLIPAHVTLCREDELEGLEQSLLRERLSAPEAAPVTLRFGGPEVFHDHGVLLPCVAGEAEFEALRRWLLGSKDIRRQAPHITLAHSRNPKSRHNNLSNLALVPSDLTFTFTIVHRIQQNDSAPWQSLEQYTLGDAADQRVDPFFKRNRSRRLA